MMYIWCWGSIKLIFLHYKAVKSYQKKQKLPYNPIYYITITKDKFKRFVVACFVLSEWKNKFNCLFLLMKGLIV